MNSMYKDRELGTINITLERQQQIDDMVTAYRNTLNQSMSWKGDDLDPEIREFVEILWQGGVYTLQSCQGGEGHSYSIPTIEFDGNIYEGMRVYSWAMNHGLPVAELRRVWSVQDRELVGPYWALTFLSTKRR